MKTARDLLLLSAVAFQQGKFDDAGALYASALSSEDSAELLQELNKLGQPEAAPLETETSVSSGGMTLSQIAKSLSTAIGENAAEAGDDEDEEDDDSESDDEEDSDEDDTDSSESTSSTAPQSQVQRKSKGERKLINSVTSPIKLK